jgi:hypothetical protein
MDNFSHFVLLLPLKHKTRMRTAAVPIHVHSFTWTKNTATYVFTSCLNTKITDATILNTLNILNKYFTNLSFIYLSLQIQILKFAPWIYSYLTQKITLNIAYYVNYFIWQLSLVSSRRIFWACKIYTPNKHHNRPPAACEWNGNIARSCLILSYQMNHFQLESADPDSLQNERVARAAFTDVTQNTLSNVASCQIK